MLAFAIIEWKDNDPLILFYHFRIDCPGLLEELEDPKLDLFRAMVRYPERISEILYKEFEPIPGDKSLIVLEPTGDNNTFKDAKGGVQTILPCKLCGKEKGVSWKIGIEQN